MNLVNPLSRILILIVSFSMGESHAAQHIGDQITYEIQNFSHHKEIKKDLITLEITSIDVESDKIITTTVVPGDPQAKGTLVEFKLSDVNSVEALYSNCIRRPDEATQKGYKTGTQFFKVNKKDTEACLLSKKKNGTTREDLWAGEVPFGIVRQVLVSGSNKEITTLKSFTLHQ